MQQYIEREILVGCITSDEYLRDLLAIYKPAYIKAKEARKVIGWCSAYYERYKKAPDTDISTIYKTNEKSMSDAEAGWISEILEFLSDEFEDASKKINAEYLFHQTQEYFEERSVKILAEEIETELANKQIPAAVDAVLKFRRIEQPNDPSINPHKGIEHVKKAFEQSATPLMRFEGALGFLLNPQLVKEGFVALMAGEKIGKTFWLSEFKFKAMQENIPTAFFQAGDMSQEQQLLRWYIYMSMKSNKQRYCNELLVPTLDCILNQNGECDDCPNDEVPFKGQGIKTMRTLDFTKLSQAYSDYPDHKPCRKCATQLFTFKGTPWFRTRKKVVPLVWKESIRNRKKYMERHRITSSVRLATYPSDQLSTVIIEQQLDIWQEREGFSPEVIIVDYADLLIPSRGMGEPTRQQQNQIWKDLRSLSQKRKALVITATQADAGAYGKESLDLSNFSEDKRKYGHVTSMFSINKTNEEKRIGQMRIGELVVREDDSYADRQVAVLGRLEMGRPHLTSYFL